MTKITTSNNYIGHKKRDGLYHYYNSVHIRLFPALSAVCL